MWIEIDDDRNCYIGNNGEYETYNIDPEVLKEAVDDKDIMKWTLCENKMPSNKMLTKYLVCDAYSNIAICYYEPIHGWFNNSILYKPIAWMQLPEPI